MQVVDSLISAFEDHEYSNMSHESSACMGKFGLDLAFSDNRLENTYDYSLFKFFQVVDNTRITSNAFECATLVSTLAQIEIRQEIDWKKGDSINGRT